MSWWLLVGLILTPYSPPSSLTFLNAHSPHTLPHSTLHTASLHSPHHTPHCLTPHTTLPHSHSTLPHSALHHSPHYTASLHTPHCPLLNSIAASAEPLPSNPLLVLGVAQEQTGVAGGITSLHHFGSGFLVVWNITSGSNASVTLSAKLVLLDLAYSGLHITFSAPVTIGNSQVMEPSVEAVVVEPSLLLHRSATTVMSPI